MLYALMIGAVLGVFSLFFRKPSTAESKGTTGVVERSKLDNVMLLRKRVPKQAISIHVFRQSGELERSFTCQDRHVALAEVQKLFNRLQEPTVRIWKNDETSCDLRRPYGSSKGLREGRKIWGCLLKTE